MDEEIKVSEERLADLYAVYRAWCVWHNTKKSETPSEFDTLRHGRVLERALCKCGITEDERTALERLIRRRKEHVLQTIKQTFPCVNLQLLEQAIRFMPNKVAPYELGYSALEAFDPETEKQMAKMFGGKMDEIWKNKYGKNF